VIRFVCVWGVGGRSSFFLSEGGRRGLGVCDMIWYRD